MVMALSGEPGAAKTTTAKIIRRLVDRNKADLRAMPRNEDDLLIAALNSHVVALDNLSHIKGDQADMLCRLANGEGFSKRQLFTDTNETIIAVARPILLTSIPNLLVRGDLADRAISIVLPAIPAHKRLPESKIWERFEAEAPGMLALLLDGVVKALFHLPTLSLPYLPRMADFALRACAAAPAFGWTAEEMFAALESNGRETSANVIEAHPLADAMLDLVTQSDSDVFISTAMDLLRRLNQCVSDETRSDRSWPKGPRQFSVSLDRIAGPLRRLGIEIAKSRDGRTGRLITIRRTRDPGAEAPHQRDSRNAQPKLVKRAAQTESITKVPSPAPQPPRTSETGPRDQGDPPVSLQAETVRLSSPSQVVRGDQPRAPRTLRLRWRR